MSRYFLYSTLSAIALLSLAPVSLAAMSAPRDFGTLQVQDRWQVGAVNAEGKPYCAMVGTYDQKVVLAFAINIDGYSSFAIDAHEDIFSRGEDYQLDISTPDGKDEKLQGRASTERSVVVQLGNSQAFFQSLTSSLQLGVATSVMQGRFSLNRFAASYDELKMCVDVLTEHVRPELRSASASPANEAERLEQLSLRLAAEQHELNEAITAGAPNEERAALAQRVRNLENALATETAALNALQPAGQDDAQLAAVETRLTQIAAEEDQKSRARLAQMDTKVQSLEQQLAGNTSNTTLLQKARNILWNDGPAVPALKVTPVEPRAVQAPTPQITTSNADGANDSAQQDIASAATETIEEKQEVSVAVLRDADIDWLEATRPAVVAQKTEEVAIEEPTQTASANAAQQQEAAALAALEPASGDMFPVASATSERTLLAAANLRAVPSQVNTSEASTTTEANADPRAGQLMRIQEMEKLQTFRQKLVSRNQDIAQVRTQRAHDTQAHIQAYQAQESNVIAQTAVARQQRAALEKTLSATTTATQDRMLKAGLVAQQAEIAALEAERGEAQRQLTENLASTHVQYDSRLANLTAERDALQRQINTMTTSLADAKDAALKYRLQSEDAQARLAAAQTQQTELKARITALERQNKLMQANLAGRSGDTVAAAQSSNVQSSSVGAEVNNASLTALRADLAKRDAQYTALQAEIAALKEGLGTANTTPLAAQGDPAVEKLKSELAAAKAARAQEAQRAARVQSDLAAARREISGLRQGAPVNSGIAMAKASRPEPSSAPGYGIRSAKGLLPSERAELAEYRRNGGRVFATSEQREDLTVPPVAAMPVTPVGSERKMLASTGTPLGSQKTSAQNAEDINAVMPAAGELAKSQPAEQQTASTQDQKSWAERMLPQGYNRASAEKKMAALADTTPAVPATQTAKVKPASPSIKRAEAFLDKIMAYHRPGENSTIDVASLAAPVSQSGAVLSDNTVSAQMANVEPAAGTTLSRQIDAHIKRPVSSAISARQLKDPTKKAGIAEHMTLEAVLADAGLRNVRYVPTSQPDRLRQWQAGSISGMYETSPARGNIMSGAQSYLDRYREDCPQDLQIEIGKAAPASSGQIVRADIACRTPGNAYNSTFSFLQSGTDFIAVLHTARPESVDQLNDTGRKVASVLKAASSVQLHKTAQSPKQAKSSLAGKAGNKQTPISLKRPAPTSVSLTAPSQSDFETVVIQ